MSIKKLLCKYCSEENDHTSVTIGSVIDSLLKLCFIIFTLLLGVGVLFICTLIAINQEVNEPNEAIILVLTAWLTAAVIISVVIAIIYLYVRSHEVEITKCDKK